MLKSLEQSPKDKVTAASLRRNIGSGPICLSIDRDSLRELVAEVVAGLPHIDWPAGRLALTEVEAASACGVCRHVLRDLRLSGHIQARRLGRRVLYTRTDLLAALEVAAL